MARLGKPFKGASCLFADKFTLKSKLKPKSLLLHVVTLATVMAPYYEFLFSNGFLEGNPIMYYRGNLVTTALLPIPYGPWGLNVLAFYVLNAAEYLFYELTQNYSTTFKIIIILAYLFYYFILNYSLDRLLRLFGVRNAYLKYVLILIFFLSPATMEDPTIYFLDFPFGAVSLVFLLYVYLYSSRDLRLGKYDLAFAGALFSASFLLDPRWFAWDTLTLVPLFASDVALNGRALRISRSLWNFVKVYAYSVPFAIFEFFSYTYGSSHFNYTGGRPPGWGVMAWQGANANLFNVLTFIVEFWPNPVFAPPSVLFYPRSYWWKLPTIGQGNPEVLWVPGNPLSYAWLLSLLVYPALVAIAAISGDRKRMSMTIPLLVAFAFLIAQASGTHFPLRAFTYWTMIRWEYLPVLGPIVATVYAAPGYEVNAALAVFVVIAVSSMKAIEGLRWRKAAFALILGLVLLGGWQNFNGTMAPGLWFGFPGNGLALDGPTAPITPPSYWMAGMMAVDSHLPAGVYMITGHPYKWELPAVSGTFYPPGFVTPNPPSTVIDGELPLSLRLVGASYLVADNTTYYPTLSREAARILDGLVDSGQLSSVYSSHSLYVFQVTNSSLAYASGLAAAADPNLSESQGLEMEEMFYGATNGSTFLMLRGGEARYHAVLNETLPNATTLDFLTPSFISGLTGSPLSDDVVVLAHQLALRVPAPSLAYVLGTNSTTVEAVGPDNPLSIGPGAALRGLIISPVPLQLFAQSPLHVSWEPITETFAVECAGQSYVQLNVPFYNWSASGGEYVGVSAFGSPAFLASGGRLAVSMLGSICLSFAAVALTAVEYAVAALFIADFFKGRRSTDPEPVLVHHRDPR